MENQKLDDAVKRVAAQLPFPITLDADMGGTFTLQIDLGTRGAPDDPHDRAGIDPGPGEVWWVDIEGGRESILSDLTADANHQEVAQWIAKEAIRAESPAAAGAVSSAEQVSAGDNTHRVLHEIEQNLIADELAAKAAEEELDRQQGIADDIQKMGYDEYVKQVPEVQVVAPSTGHLHAAASAEYDAIDRTRRALSEPTPPATEKSTARHRSEPVRRRLPEPGSSAPHTAPGGSASSGPQLS